jgi:hypothetical protein
VQVCRAGRKLSRRTAPAEAMTWNRRFLAIPSSRQEEAEGLTGDAYQPTRPRALQNFRTRYWFRSFSRGAIPAVMSTSRSIGRRHWEGKPQLKPDFEFWFPINGTTFERRVQLIFGSGQNRPDSKRPPPTLRNDTEGFKCLPGSGLPSSGLF